MPVSPEYHWSPREFPDPPEDRPLGIAPGAGAVPVNGHPPVWVRVRFTRTGPQRCPGFVEQASAERVYVQLVHMGFVHHVWLPRPQVTHRELRSHRRGQVPAILER